MLISIITGVAAGAIHVVGGADHLVAMAPVAIRHPRIAIRNGLAWGLGHSAGVLLLSTLAILVKDLAHIERMSSFAELCVGIGLLVVGGLAIRTSLGLNIHAHVHNHKDGRTHEHIHSHFGGRQKHNRHAHAVTSLGVLHGLAGASHLLAVFPAMALPPIGAISYMAGYFCGSLVTMAMFLMVVSLATIKVGLRALPLIIGLAGGLSVITGLFWLQNSWNYLV